jgi:hypothetical protein
LFTKYINNLHLFSCIDAISKFIDLHQFGFASTRLGQRRRAGWNLAYADGAQDRGD